MSTFNIYFIIRSQHQHELIIAKEKQYRKEMIIAKEKQHKKEKKGKVNKYSKRTS